jgi:hypothetical protein
MSAGRTTESSEPQAWANLSSPDSKQAVLYTWQVGIWIWWSGKHSQCGGRTGHKCLIVPAGVVPHDEGKHGLCRCFESQSNEQYVREGYGKANHCSVNRSIVHRY